MSEPKRLGDLLGLSLDDLRAIEQHCDRNDRDPRFEARERAEAQARKDEEAADLQSMTNKALSGVYGGAAKKAAERWQAEVKGEPNEWHMVQLRTLLQRIPGRQSG